MHSQRKLDHIRVNLEENVQFPRLTTGFERYAFVHQALPELDLEQVDLTTSFLGHRLRLPLLISSMTGGTERAGLINANLAEAAEAAGIAMGLGSQRAGIEHPETVATFAVARERAPHAVIFGNLGAVQFNYGYGLDQARRAVDMVKADGLIVHLNPLQEALQYGGNTNWQGLLDKIGDVARRLDVPVIAKEVGWGLSGEVASALLERGVAALDVAGAGGTSWSEVERHLTPDERLRRIARRFADWGIPTAESLRMVREAAPDVPLVASGGVRSGVDGAKAIALGADLFGLASPFLKAAAVSAEAAVQTAEEIAHELRIAMFLVGAGSLTALKNTPRLRRLSPEEAIVLSRATE